MANSDRYPNCDHINIGSRPDLRPVFGSALSCPNEGESVTVPLVYDNPCISCKCNNREVVCQREVCTNFNGCYLLYYEKNKTCCDVCKGCQYNGHYYKSGETFVDDNNLCTSFVCNSGVITEYNTYCHIPCDNPIEIAGQCCPSCEKCDPLKEGQPVANPYNTTDTCIGCECLRGHTVCSKHACPVLPCPESKWFTPPNQCCPICKSQRKVMDFEGNCIMKLSTHRDGQTYTYDHCTNCVCNATTNICQRKVCPPLSCSLTNQITELGECCPKCVETQETVTTCSYKGKEYKSGDNWKHNNCHKCSCLNGQISGTSVMIKIDDIKVRLGQAFRVTVGRKRVRLPHIRLGVLSIVRDSHKVTIRATIGLKVIWESGKSIEIIVPPEFKSRTCGLCGNYNNNPNDDFITKRGKIYTEVEKFTHSWKVGKNVICESAMKSTKALKEQMRCSFTDWEQRHNAINVCNILKSALFRQCHNSISITTFFGKCLSDVCSCHKNKICHCNAIQSYATQCQKLGHKSQHWKKSTLCEAMNCPSGSTFSTCTSACRRTCNHSHHNETNCRQRKCRPGCMCPIGQVWHNGVCIYKQLCPKHHNTTRQSIDTFHENTLKDEAIGGN
ncbi:unnamed protein product [Medioppia subpectinata]|uniref:BMP-binding endothelial regulator protein n=1 Tax=Medioppia subpectinata TaxID=1979941 RepID=A0A7R9KLI6_9ACAR|nr:unnamed protein product [Medioppia subpectinata]CAG2104699.1 unnamed protein product [Medioppia subpectinata]